jgi:pectinesterase
MFHHFSTWMRRSAWLLALTLVVILTSAGQREKTTIFMIGDSTMANKPTAKDNQERGWGQMLSGFFTDDIVVDNHAVNGRSSKSFIDEGRWDAVLGKIKPGDYVFIQFGHNDEKPKADRHTDPGSTFDANLRRFCEETRAKGGIPVLFNSIVRRNFFNNANAVTDDDLHGEKTTRATAEGDSLIETHILTAEDGTKLDYLASPRNVAAELGVPFVDMNRLTHDLVQGLGAEGSKSLYCWIPAGTNVASPNGREDNTHLNIHGARLIAGLTVDAIGEAVPALKPYIRHYDFVVAKDGSGDFFTVQEAINAVPDYRKKTTTILVADGTYHEKLVVAESKTHVQLIARTEGAAVIEYDDYAQKHSTLGEEKGTSGSATAYIYAPDFEADGITFSNTAGPVGQAVAVLVKGDRAVFRKCRFLGHQDTLYAYGQQYSSQSRQYYEDCYIEGTVDYIFGWATAVFNRCELHSVNNGYVTAAATPEGQAYGYVFFDCHLTAAPGVKAYLGRPWRPYAQVVYIRCEMDDFIHADGWKHWNDKETKKKGSTAFYAEYQSTGLGAATSKRAAWSHQLTAKEAAAYTIENILKGDDNWTPAITQP